MSSEGATATGRDLAIRVTGLSKRYRLGARQPYKRLGESIARTVLKPFRATTALR